MILYNRYDGVDVGDERGNKVGVKAPHERDSSYNRYCSPSPKRARSGYPSRTIHSPHRAHSDYRSHDKSSPSPKRDHTSYPSRNNHSLPKRDYTGYPSRDNHSSSPKQVRADYTSRDNYSSSPKRDRSDYPSRSPRKSRASYEDTNSHSPSPNPKRSWDHSPSKSRSPIGSILSPRNHSTRDSVSPNPKKWHGRSPSCKRTLSHSASPSNSPYQRRSRIVSCDQDQDLDHPVGQVDSPRPASVSPPASPRNVSAPIKEKIDNIYSDQMIDGSDSTIRESNGGYAGENGSHSPRWKGGNDGMEGEGEEEGVDILADVD